MSRFLSALLSQVTSLRRNTNTATPAVCQARTVLGSGHSAGKAACYQCVSSRWSLREGQLLVFLLLLLLQVLSSKHPHLCLCRYLAGLSGWRSSGSLAGLGRVVNWAPSAPLCVPVTRAQKGKPALRAHRSRLCPPHARVTPLPSPRTGHASALRTHGSGLCVTVVDRPLPSPASGRWGAWRCLSEKKNLSSVHNELSPEAVGHTILPLF